MRIVYDSTTSDFIQFSKDPDVGEYAVSNGVHILDLPPGVERENASGWISDAVDAFDNASYGLLSLYPGFAGIQPNVMARNDDVYGVTLYPTVWSIDLAGTVDNTLGGMLPAPYTKILNTRAQVFRAGAGVPMSSALLPVNGVSDEPGMLVTQSLDLTAATGGLGADEFMVYWRIYTYTMTHEVIGDTLSTTNVPTYKLLNEIDQEPATFVVGISVDGGDFEPVSLMETYRPVVAGTAIKLCFLNTSSDKIYLGSFALMFNIA